MNILVEQLPTAIEIDGRAYEIRADFRTAVRILLAYEDGELTPVEKQMLLIENLYCEIPHDVKAGIEKAIRFLDGGRSEPESTGGSSFRLYSFGKDANLIYAAFQQTHGIDLQKENLHWWQFLALFSDLGADTVFCSLVGLRKRVKEGKASKEERQMAREMGDVFTVPEIDTRTLEEKEKELDFMRMLGKGKTT